MSYNTESFPLLVKSRYGRDIPGSAARGTGGPYPLPGQYFSRLPGDWIRSSHMAPG